MLRCNLSILLAERGLTISKVSMDTGISRTTLTALSRNRSEGIQLETLNRLCRYLKIKPDFLLSFSPLEIKLKKIELVESKQSYASNSDTLHYQEVFVLECSSFWDDSILCPLHCDINAKRTSDDAASKDTITCELLFSFLTCLDYTPQDAHLVQTFSKLTRPFLTDIEKELSYAHSAVSGPLKLLPSKYNSVLSQYTFHWPEELVQHIQF